jgi:hypothetical protein
MKILLFLFSRRLLVNIQSCKIMIALVIASMLMIGGCPQRTKKQEKQNQPPEMESVYITPKDARPRDQIRTGTSVVDKDGDKVIVEYEWYLNGEKLEGETGEILETDSFYEGDKIYAKVRPVEAELGKTGKWVKTKEIVLGNMQGMKLGGIKIEPVPLNVNVSAKAIVDYGDVDKYSIDGVFFKWMVGNQEVSGEESDTLDGEYFIKGKYVSVKACTNGLFEPKNTVTSDQILVLNIRPKFSGDPKPDDQGPYIVYDFKVYDPDDDYHTFSLQQGPPGAYIPDPERGEVRIPDDTEPGRYTLSIKVTDDYGGAALGKKVISVR